MTLAPARAYSRPLGFYQQLGTFQKKLRAAQLYVCAYLW